MSLIETLRATLACPPPLPGAGKTPDRHRFLYALGRRDLSLARLAEAHWDAVAILSEAGKEPVPNSLYGVWASETPNQPITLTDGIVCGTKPFCSGAGLVDRALVTVTKPFHQLLDIDLRTSDVAFDASTWHTHAFADTMTCSATFNNLRVSEQNFIGPSGFYLSRAGFWHGACGPACCWAGGAAGLVDWALQQSRNDPHTLAHLGAMHVDIWALEALLDSVGAEIDDQFSDSHAAHIRALSFRHLIEVHATDILRRLPRAYGPYPLAFEEAISTRYQELDLYLRQSHAERDLAALGTLLTSSEQPRRCG